MKRYVVLGSPGNVRHWLIEHDLDHGDVVTMGGMLLGRQFTADQIVVLDDLAAWTSTDRMLAQTREWLTRLSTKMAPGETFPVEIP